MKVKSCFKSCFSWFSSVIDHKFCHNIVQAAVDMNPSDEDKWILYNVIRIFMIINVSILDPRALLFCA